jgi:hypothetical protein
LRIAVWTGLVAGGLLRRKINSRRPFAINHELCRVEWMMMMGLVPPAYFYARFERHWRFVDTGRERLEQILAPEAVLVGEYLADPQVET